MFTKTIAAAVLAVMLASTATAVAQGWRGGYGYYRGGYGYGGYGYGGSGRGDPTNTNGGT